MIMMLFSFWALVEDMPIIANMTLIALLALLYIARMKVKFKRMTIIFALFYGLMHFLAITGNLYSWYAGLKMMIPLLSLSLSLYHEYLASFKSIKAAETAYLTYLMGAIVFGVGLFIIRDIFYYVSLIPNGFISVLSLTSIIFIPYLLMMTLSFLVHEYNN